MQLSEMGCMRGSRRTRLAGASGLHMTNLKGTEKSLTAAMGPLVYRWSHCGIVKVVIQC